MNQESFTVKISRKGSQPRYITDAVVIEGFVFYCIQKGVGLPVRKIFVNQQGENEEWEEYKSFRVVYVPLFDGQKLQALGYDPDQAQNAHESLPLEQIITKYRACLCQMGDNQGLSLEKFEAKTPNQGIAEKDHHQQRLYKPFEPE